MFIVIAIYAVLLIVFLVVSGLIFRHTVKFGYLSPRFKTIASVFGIFALIIIILSIYLVVGLLRAPPSTPSYSYPSFSTPSDINF